MMIIVFFGGAVAGCFLGVAIMALANLLSDMDDDEIGIGLGDGGDD